LRPNGACNEEFMDAIRAADAPAIRALTARRVQARCVEPGVDGAGGSTTPLDLAVATGQPEVVHAVIAAGADLSSEGAAIYRAVRSRRFDLVTLLLDSGASADSWGSGRPILREAILQDDIGMASLLLGRGADPNQRWFSELQPGGDVYDPATFAACFITPLIEAAARGQSQMVSLLLRAGADRALIDCKGPRRGRLRTRTAPRRDRADAGSLKLNPPLDFATEGSAAHIPTAASICNRRSQRVLAPRASAPAPRAKRASRTRDRRERPHPRGDSRAPARMRRSIAPATVSTIAPTAPPDRTDIPRRSHHSRQRALTYLNTRSSLLSGSKYLSTTRSLSGMMALSVMWMCSGHTFVQHLVMLQ
jgi:hypothetical protein